MQEIKRERRRLGFVFEKKMELLKCRHQKQRKNCRLKWNFVLTIRETLDIKNAVSLVETSSAVKERCRVFILNFEKKEKKQQKIRQGGVTAVSK